MIEISIYGRAGQGGITLAYFLAEYFFKQGYFVKAFPDYGAEKSGAPVRAYLRIDKKEIRTNTSIVNPNIIVFLDSTLLDIFEGKTDLAIINTRKPKSSLKLDAKEFYSVDALSISRECLNNDMVNLPILGSLIKTSKLFNEKDILIDLKSQFKTKFSDEVINKTIQAIQKVKEQTK